MPDEPLFEALSTWNLWGKRQFSTGIQRAAAAPLEPFLGRPEALALCGMRRTGKSTLMRQLLRGLVDRGVPERDTLFVNLEEPVLHAAGEDPALLDRLLESYAARLRPGPRPYVFLDEVHNVAGWARWVRARSEAGRACFVVSGSTSQLTEPAVATVLTGRTLTRTVWPLSFVEHLRFRGLEVGDEASVLAQGERIRQELHDYLRFGGLPEVTLTAAVEVREALLKQYFRDLVYRDVVFRHEVRDVRALEQLALHYLASTASPVTFNRVKNVYGLAMDQARAYTAYLEEAYLVRLLPRFSFKAGQQARAPRKVYAVDGGLRNAVVFRFSADLGRLAETAVHNHLARDEDLRLYYFVDQGECDFVAWRGDRARAAIQVCYEPGPDLPDRELAGLLAALRALGLEHGTVVTRDATWERVVDGRTVRARPLWRWLLEPPDL